MRALVTGASGFIGRHVALGLSRHGVDVIAASRRRVSFPESVQVLQVEEYTALPPADVLLHFAELSVISQADAAGGAHRHETVGRLRALLETGNHEYVVYASSAAIYGDSEISPRRPDEALEPPRPVYAATKYECERLALERNGLVLRLGNIIGPGMSPGSVVTDVLRQIPGTQPIFVRDTSVVRDYLWVGDAVEATVALVLGGRRGVFNIGSGIATSVLQLARAALRAFGQPERQVQSLQSPAKPSHLVLDISATSAAIGWKPTTTLEEALRMTTGSNRE